MITVHSRFLIRACCLLLGSACVVTTAAQTPATGVIAGRVIAADTGKPLAGASVRLAGFAGAGTANASATVPSNDDGEFVFPNLAPGRYYVTASRPRYVTLGHGQRAGSGLPGVSIAVQAGAKVTGLSISLPLAAVISGRADDERGEPAMGANVSAWLVEWRNGERSLRAVASDVVDDRGNYRITNLVPGTYVVTAFRPQTLPPGARMLYHPGSTDPSLALPFAVDAGLERGGINFVFPASGLAGGVSGVVTTDGKPAPNVKVSALTADSLMKGLDFKSTYTTRTGEFEIRDLAPGVYNLIAWVEPGARVESGHLATRDVVVDAVIVKNVELILRAGSRASGTIVGLPPDTTARPTIMLAALDRDTRNTGSHWTRAEAGAFTVRGIIPGRYAVSVGELPPGLRVASVRQNGRDIHDLSVTIGADQELGDIAVTLSNTPTTLKGTLFDKNGAPTPDYLVVVFPEDEQYRWPGTPRIKADQPASDGRFTFSNLPPGKYRMAVVTDAEAGEWLSPEFLQQISSASIAVTIATGVPVTQDLRVR